ncbi:spore cortex biosynthesis protein YabQ [Ruminococcus sp.]|uniref:spore cortex biosynthesis protein YabQ n=1 Tax=Ruminococcus sp. TaxID=41978 RepID=UPI0038639EE3
MGISLSAQTAYFLWSLVLGVALGMLYDVIRAARMVLRAGKIHVLISDIVFFTVCGVITSLFSLPFNKGDVRAFILFGEAVGFLTYRITMGSIMGKVYAFLARKIRSFVQKIRKILQIFFNYLLKSIAFVLYNVGVVIDKLHSFAAKKQQKHRAKKVKRQQRRIYKDKYHEQKRNKKTAYRVKAKTRQRRRAAERG